MQIPTLHATRSAARDAYQEYAEACRINPNHDDEAIKRAFYALSQGKRVIDLFEVLKAAGLDAKGRPHLAISRADQRECFLSTGWTNYFQHRRWADGRSRTLRIEFPRHVFGGDLTKKTWRCLVPSVPPRHRPLVQRNGQTHYVKLSNYYILFEAEWDDVPVDPVLLRSLGGSMYVILAEWDLSAVEQAALHQYL